MGSSKKMSKGIGIGVLVLVIVIILVFTNVGDLLLQEIPELTSKIKVSDPISSYKSKVSDQNQPYKINTNCELVEFFNESGNVYKAFDLIYQNPQILELKYYEKGGNKQDLSQSHSLIREISAEMIAEEYSINPVLKETLIDLIEQQTALEWNIKLKSLNSDCNTDESSENQNSSTYTAIPKSGMSTVLTGGHEYIVDKNIQLSELKEGDVIVYKNNLETDPYRFSRVIVKVPDSDYIRTKLDMQHDSIQRDYPSDKNEFIGKVIGKSRNGEETPLPPYVSENITPEGTGVLGSEHLHASILVKIGNNPTIGYASPVHQIRSAWIGFEGGDGFTIHKHATGVTLGYLFETLRSGLTENCLGSDTGTQFCTLEGHRILEFYINGDKVDDIQDYSFVDDDRILISYGEGTPKEIKKQLQELESKKIIR